MVCDFENWKKKVKERWKETRGSLYTKKEDNEVLLQSLSKYRQCWCVHSDFCGLLSSNMSISLHLFALYTQFRYVLIPWQRSYFGFWSVAYLFLCTMACTSHLRCQFTQPGVVPKSLNASTSELMDLNTKKYTKKRRFCRYCQIIKPREAHHCSTCQRCIIRMDHHCPWINNCVGALNQKYFLLFLFYTCLCSVFCVGTLWLHVISCYGSFPKSNVDFLDWCGYDGPHEEGWPPELTLNLLQGVLCALLTSIMGCDQVAYIKSGVSKKDKMKGKDGNRRGCLQFLDGVFGQPFSIMWFLPTQVSIKLIKEFESACLSLPGEEV